MIKEIPPRSYNRKRGNRPSFKRGRTYKHFGYEHRVSLEDADTFQCNPTEQQFLERAREKGGKALRGGWPDFLIERDGKTIGVEVKTNRDPLRPGQRTMFIALERAGIKVYVWTPHTADRLMPWRKYRTTVHNRGPISERALKRIDRAWRNPTSVL